MYKRVDRMELLRIKQFRAISAMEVGMVKHWAISILDSSPRMDKLRFVVVWKVPVQKDESLDPYDYCDVVLLEMDNKKNDIKAILLVVNCVMRDDDTRKPLPRLRLYNCMHDSKCELGILMSSGSAFIFKDNHNGGLDEIGGELDLLSEEGFNQLLAFTDPLSEDKD